MFESKINVKLTIDSLFHHLSQIYTGFEMLKEAGIITLDYHISSKIERMHFIVQSEVEGKLVIFDLRDDVGFDKTLYDKSDFYFKRMLLKSDLPFYPKINPLGFNNAVYHQIYKFLQIPLKTRSIRNIMQILRFNKILSQVLNKDESVLTRNYLKLERPPSKDIPNMIFFCARLWDPEWFAKEEEKEECEEINKTRIVLAQTLKDTFRDNFFGGIQDDSFARKMCPDILLPKSYSSKSGYLKNLRKCTIGIASPGLYKSVGWKFTEYISNSCAIVTSPIDKYAFPGQFGENINYLTYKSIDECVRKVETLLNNKGERNNMMDNNYSYYKSFIHPEKLILNVLGKVLA